MTNDPQVLENMLIACAKDYRANLDNKEVLTDLLTRVESDVMANVIIAGIKERKLMTTEELAVIDQLMAEIKG